MAVVKSPWWRFITKLLEFIKGASTILSTVAPFAIVPTVGILTDIEEPSAPSTPKPPTAKFPCAIAYVCPSAPFKGAISNVPPLKLFALPMDETVTPIFCPTLVNGIKSAVIITAAEFFPLKLLVSTFIPNCDIVDCILWSVNARDESPVPSSPTTIP